MTIHQDKPHTEKRLITYISREDLDINADLQEMLIDEEQMQILYKTILTCAILLIIVYAAWW